MSAPATGRSGGAFFGIVSGFLAGVLIAALFVPKRHHVSSSLLSGSGEVTTTSIAASTPSAAGAAPSAPPVSSVGGASSSSGTTGGGGPATAGAQSTATTAAARSASGPMGRGVSANKIVIGVTYPDLTALRALGPEFDNGDVAKQWQALLDGWHKQHLVPVNGRDIELRFAKYNVLDVNDQNAACAQLVDDDKVFAVVGVAYFQTGAECVARAHRTPLITSDGPTDDVFARSKPFLFSLSMSDSRHLRNWVWWAHTHGFLKNKKIGIYYETTPGQPELVQNAIVSQLTKLGYKVTAEASTGDTQGGPEDAIAVQKFSSMGVNLAMLLTSKMGFMQQADAQGYHPTYIDNDHLYGTSDTATSTYPADQFAGTYAMTGRRVGDAAAGKPLTPDQEACVANYERYTGQKVLRPGPKGHLAAVFAYILEDCDEGAVLLQGIRGAGTTLNNTTFVAALEQIRNMALTRYPPVTFTATKHDGTDSQRTLLWKQSCTCWTAVTGFSPLWVS